MLTGKKIDAGSGRGGPSAEAFLRETPVDRMVEFQLRDGAGRIFHVELGRVERPDNPNRVIVLFPSPAGAEQIHIRVVAAARP